MSVDELIDEILRREGGFVNHPADQGGPTNHGITQTTLAAWRGHPVTIEDVQALGTREARAIYIDGFLVGPGFHQIRHVELQALIVDCGVNHSPRRAAKWLQRAAGVFADGVVGPRTLAAVNAAEADALYRRVLVQRTRFYGRLITLNPSQAVFAEGWANRLSEFIEMAP